MKLEIEKLSFGGDGIARHEGLVYFVPFSVPGDQLQVRVTEKKKNFARAEIIEILRPGPTRQKPPCPVFGLCGGCNWQQLSYDEQLIQKQRIVEEQLGPLLNNAVHLAPIISSPKPLRYRNRIQLKFDGKSLGFFARQSHDVVDIEDCLITEERLCQRLSEIKRSLLEKKSKALPKIEIFLSAEGGVETVFEESPHDSSGFSQVNTLQNEHLIDVILQWMQADSPHKIYDLYAGSGNFTFPLLNVFPKASFVGVELNAKSVAFVQKKINDLNLSPLRVQFFMADVEIYLKKQKLHENATVLLDPPRSGCSREVLHALAQQKLQKIVYLSCNPSALPRDLKILQEQGSWKLRKVQAFDMFPQTDHIETLVELTR